MPTTRHPNKTALARLFEIAEAQEGYFTAKQAEAAGFDKKNHHYHVATGNWIRECRGVYHLAKFPIVEHPDMITWSLWSRDRTDKPQGVYSHETALSYYDLSDVNPAKLHMTVSPEFRRNSPIPGVLVLHRARLHDDEIQSGRGFRLTRPLKTITDLLTTRTVQMDHMAQAVKQAFERGLITRTMIERDSRISLDMKKEIEQLRTQRYA